MDGSAPEASAPGRIAAIDLIRGIAVLGILAVNSAGFAGPMDGVYSPHVPTPGSPADSTAFAVMLVLFEGKMRALLSIVFGASIVLFVDRAEDRGEDGQLLEMRRLGWLAGFGYLHFLFLWWGDILFLYAIAGLAALALRQLPRPAMLIAALLAFTAWQAEGIVRQWPLAEAEAQVARGAASSDQRDLLNDAQSRREEDAAREMIVAKGSFAGHLRARIEDGLYPAQLVVGSIGETLPYMLIGMLLLRSGFLSGHWSRRRLAVSAIACLAAGTGSTLAFTLWAWRRGFPEEAMRLAINHGLAFPHLSMALAYLALAMMIMPRLLATRLGDRLRAAGRMALTNYLATSLVMTAIFYGWGLGLIGRFGDASLAAFVAAGWAAMLLWSKPWLERHRAGPVEALWRRLVRPATGP